MQLARLLAAVLIIISFILLAPNLAKCELGADSGFELDTLQDQDLDLHFSSLDVEARANTEDDDYNIFSKLDDQYGYWFEEAPWLGVTSEAPLFRMDRQESYTSMDADTDFDPLSSFLLFRYQKGQLQPYLGIGPSNLISDLGDQNLDAFRQMFLGISYRF
jgi:hypothetical protein